MIIIKIIILYFIQIIHTDDFLSTGLPASTNKVFRHCSDDKVCEDLLLP